MPTPRHREFPVSKNQPRLRIRARGGPGLCPYFHIQDPRGEYFADQLNYLFCEGSEHPYPARCPLHYRDPLTWM